MDDVERAVRVGKGTAVTDVQREPGRRGDRRRRCVGRREDLGSVVEADHVEAPAARGRPASSATGMSAPPVPTSSRDSARWAASASIAADETNATEPAIDPPQVAQVVGERGRVVQRAVEQFDGIGQAVHRVRRLPTAAADPADRPYPLRHDDPAPGSCPSRSPPCSSSSGRPRRPPRPSVPDPEPRQPWRRRAGDPVLLGAAAPGHGRRGLRRHDVDAVKARQAARGLTPTASSTTRPGEAGRAAHRQHGPGGLGRPARTERKRHLDCPSTASRHATRNAVRAFQRHPGCRSRASSRATWRELLWHYDYPPFNDRQPVRLQRRQRKANWGTSAAIDQLEAAATGRRDGTRSRRGRRHRGSTAGTSSATRPMRRASTSTSD